jgi:hypothetical protein
MSPRGARKVFGESLFLLGKYPDRPVPVHIANGFLTAALGQGSSAAQIRRWLRDPETPLPSPPFGKQMAQGARSERLRRALRVIVDPDRRVWEKIGSLFPLHGDLVGRDPSDDGLGRAVWSTLQGYAPDLRTVLFELLNPPLEEAVDSVTALAVLLGRGGGGSPQQSAPAPQSPVEWDVEPSGIGGTLAEALAVMVTNAIEPGSGRSRSSRLVQLTSSTHFAAWLISLRTPPLLRPRDPRTWSELAPLFFYAGSPPGDPSEPAVRLATRSFDAVVGEHRRHLRDRLRTRLGDAKLPKRLPKAQRGRTLLSQVLGTLPDKQLASLVAAVGSEDNVDEICDIVLGAVYPPGHLERGFRSMGRKVGVAGPIRGRGSPRFLFETNVLGLLVDATVSPRERVQFEDWLDRLYARFGILIGFGRTIDWAEHLGDLDDPGPLYHALQTNHENMRRRLLRSGLAAEYSDAETEVHCREEVW